MQQILFMCIISEGLIVVLCGKLVCVCWHASAQAQRGVTSVRSGLPGRLRPAATASVLKRTRAAGFDSDAEPSHTWRRRLDEIIDCVEENVGAKESHLCAPESVR